MQKMTHRVSKAIFLYNYVGGVIKLTTNESPLEGTECRGKCRDLGYFRTQVLTRILRSKTDELTSK
jgi:hypothetical protein